MLDVVLIKLIAAGIERICRPLADDAHTVPVELDGEELIRQLSAAEPEVTAKLIADVVELVWQSCQAVGLPAGIAEPHLAALPAIIDRSYVRAADRALFLGADVDAPKNVIAELSQRLIASSAPDPGAVGPSKTGLDDRGLDDTVLVYLLESFLQSLNGARLLVQKIQPVLIRILSGRTQAERAATREQEAVTLAKIGRADALGIPVPLLDVITVSLINLTRTADLKQADLLAVAADARALGAVFERLPEIAPAQAGALDPLPGAFRAGKTVDCDRLLATAEDQIVKHSIDTSAHAAGHAPVAIELRKARARLAALESHFTKAARHYGFAQRYVSPIDIDMRWQLARQEAHYYELAAFRGEDHQGLENAARACTSMLAALPEGPASLTRASIQACLGHILILLGEKESQAGRFELAGQLLSDAREFLGGMTEPNGLMPRVDVFLATALVRLGELHRDGALIEQGARMYQAVIEAPGPRPVDDFEGGELLGPMFGLRPRLALAMLSYARLEQETGLREPAIANIETELPDILNDQTSYNRSGYDRCILAARCHKALAEWYTNEGDKVAADESLAEVARYCAAAGLDDILSGHGSDFAEQRFLEATS